MKFFMYVYNESLLLFIALPNKVKVETFIRGAIHGVLNGFVKAFFGYLFCTYLSQIVSV